MKDYARLVGWSINFLQAPAINCLVLSHADLSWSVLKSNSLDAQLQSRQYDLAWPAGELVKSYAKRAPSFKIDQLAAPAEKMDIESFEAEPESIATP